MKADQQTVVIIGAGPYGLAAAAQLRAAGVDARVFGEPMDFWQYRMPAGMRLRSSWEASTIGDPRGPWTLDRYEAMQKAPLQRPIPLADFVAYGQWFQQQAAPDLDRRRVVRLERGDEGFRISLDDGDVLHAGRAVVATGIAQFAYRPPQFAALPPALASHSAEHNDLGRFAGRRIAVVGSGQSAIESAVLLSERGAEVEVIARAPRIRWLLRTSVFHRLAPVRRLLYARTDVGPVGLSRLVALPDLFRLLPRRWQESLAYRSIRPAAAAWLRPGFGKVALTAGRNVVSALPAGGKAALRLDDGSDRYFDHVLLATGFRIDVGRLPFLTPLLLSGVDRVDGYPQLRSGLESSVPGLHFLGAPAARSFGPIMRFVSGTEYAVRALTRAVAGRDADYSMLQGRPAPEPAAQPEIGATDQRDGAPSRRAGVV